MDRHTDVRMDKRTDGWMDPSAIKTTKSGLISELVLILNIEYGKCPKISETIPYCFGLNFACYRVVS